MRRSRSLSDACRQSRRAAKTYIRVTWRYHLGKLKVLSGHEVCSILAAHGFQEKRQTGSHIVMQKAVDKTTYTAIVPNHKEVDIGTLGSIIRQAVVVDRKLFEVD